MKYIPPVSYLDIMQFYICRTTNDAVRFVGYIYGDGFEKLGFKVPFANDYNSDRRFVGSRHADLSQPPVILL